MTPEEEKWHKQNLAACGKENLYRIAENHVFVEIIADLICQMTGRTDGEAVRDEIRQKIRQRQEQYLLTVESLNPGLAAAMDQDQPLFPPDDSKTP